jgi:hypothetical protein
MCLGICGLIHGLYLNFSTMEEAENYLRMEENQ